MSLCIEKLYIISFGQFENVHIDFSPAFNLIYGKNESGKSTIVSFIEGLLYGFDDGKKVRHFNKKQEIYKPIHSYKYAGFGIFSKDGTNYRISRNFFDGTYEIYNLDTNEVVESKASNLNYPGEFLLGIDYDLYKNLIANYQSQESLAAIKDKISEILSSGDDYYFSPALAIENLKGRLAEIGTPRAYTKAYAKTTERIENLENDLAYLKTLRKNYKTDLEKLYKNRDKIYRNRQKLDELKKIRDDYRNNPSYKSLEEQIKYQNELNFVEKELAKYEDYQDYNLDDSHNKIDWRNFLIYALTSLFFVMLWLQSKLPYLLVLALILPLVIYFIEKYKKGKNTDKKYNLDENYIIYKGLIKAKERLVELIRVLEMQNSNLEDYLAIKNIDINEIYDKISKIDQDLQKLNDDNLALEKNLSPVEEKLSKEVDLKDELNFQKEKLSQMEKEIDAIKLAISTIDEISKDNKANLAKHSKEVSHIISQLCKGKYEKITYDKNLLPAILQKDGSYLDLDRLSTGFYDQMNFAFKFSINEQNLDTFMIFDDAFINYDLDRLRIALFYLLDLGDFRQIIYFTCHGREEDILDSEGIDYKIIDLEDI